MSPTWLGAWWRAMHDAPVEPFGQRSLVALMVRDEHQALRGAALFSRRWARIAKIPRVRLDALGTGEPEADEVCTDYPTVLAAEPDRGAVAQAVISALAAEGAARWDELTIPMMRRDDPMIGPLTDAAARRGLDVTLDTTGVATFCKLAPSFDAYLAAMPKKHRYAIRRTVSDFEAWAAEGGGVTFDRVRDPTELPEGFATFIDLHAARWGKGHLFTSERFTRFHEEVTRRMIEGVDGRLDLWVLRGRGQPVAALYNIACGDSIVNYQAGRLVDLPKGIKPGMVANVYAIRRAIEEGLKEYDFLPGEALYKLQLGNARREVVTLRVSRSDARAVGLDLLSNLLKRAATALRRGPAQGPESSRAAAAVDADG